MGHWLMVYRPRWAHCGVFIAASPRQVTSLGVFSLNICQLDPSQWRITKVQGPFFLFSQGWGRIGRDQRRSNDYWVSSRCQVVVRDGAVFLKIWLHPDKSHVIFEEIWMQHMYLLIRVSCWHLPRQVHKLHVDGATVLKRRSLAPYYQTRQ